MTALATQTTFTFVKRCSRCKTVKDESEFSFNNTHNALAAWCKTCHAAYCRDRYGTKAIEPQSWQVPNTDPASLKTCPSCGERKPRALFYKRKVTLDGREGSCKACRDLKRDLKRPRKRTQAAVYANPGSACAAAEITRVNWGSLACRRKPRIRASLAWSDSRRPPAPSLTALLIHRWRPVIADQRLTAAHGPLERALPGVLEAAPTGW
jgi:hypothetical protein